MSKLAGSTPLALRVDRDLPVSIHGQLVGQIEYGVSSGRLPPGSRLPSVRELAERLEVSPVTVSNVFRTLRERELIETVPGSGTFVARAHPTEAAADRPLPTLHRAVDELLRLADRLGVSRDELSGLLTLRLAQDVPPVAPLDVRFVGIFEAATRDYGRDVAERLGATCTVETVVFDALDEGALASLREADLLLTFLHRRKDLERLLPDGPPIGAVRFIPSTRVRTQLAALSPFARLGLISSFPEFLPTFLEGVRGFAQHVAHVRGTVRDADDVDAVVADSDVVIYATGAESVTGRLPPFMETLEYRHVPDPVWIEDEIAPIVRSLLASGAASPVSRETAEPPRTFETPTASPVSATSTFPRPTKE